MDDLERDIVEATALMILPIGMDGLGSYFGFWESNQLMRVLSGSLVGAVVPGFLLLAVNFDPAQGNKQPIEFCERYDLNPYQLISSGSMLITTDHGRTLVNELEQAGIKATIIGHTTDSRDKVIYRQGKAANLEAPRQDELYKIYSENNRR